MSENDERTCAMNKSKQINCYQTRAMRRNSSQFNRMREETDTVENMSRSSDFLLIRNNGDDYCRRAGSTVRHGTLSVEENIGDKKLNDMCRKQRGPSTRRHAIVDLGRKGVRQGLFVIEDGFVHRCP